MRLFLLILLVSVATPAVAQPATYVIDTESSLLSYTGRHFTGGWTGVSRAVTGMVIVDPADPSSARIELTAPVESFDSGNNSRDSNMLGAVRAHRHPEVRFVSERVRTEGWSRQGTTYSGRWLVDGRMSFHGQTRAVTIPVDVTIAGDAFSGNATFDLTLTDFDVRRPRLLMTPISDSIVMEGRIRAGRVTE
jgi:polyisoprenoid-binding protein YceI